jgi:acyl carrier protein
MGAECEKLLTDICTVPSVAWMKNGLEERLAALLADVCGTPASSLGPSSAAGVTPGWDSVAMLGFIAAVEDDLGITITTAEALGIKTLADMTRLVATKVASG